MVAHCVFIFCALCPFYLMCRYLHCFQNWSKDPNRELSLFLGFLSNPSTHISHCLGQTPCLLPVSVDTMYKACTHRVCVWLALCLLKGRPWVPRVHWVDLASQGTLSQPSTKAEPYLYLQGRSRSGAIFVSTLTSFLKHTCSTCSSQVLHGNVSIAPWLLAALGQATSSVWTLEGHCLSSQGRH